MAKKMNFTRRNRTKRTIENVGFMQIKDAAAGGVELYIYGDIVSSAWDKWTSEDTCPQDITDFLNGIDNNAELTVYFNSCGGDVFAGIGIYNILKRQKLTEYISAGLISKDMIDDLIETAVDELNELKKKNQKAAEAVTPPEEREAAAVAAALQVQKIQTE